jgi:tripartite-type tricarboxylate transporter receptor subunit TctC
MLWAETSSFLEANRLAGKPVQNDQFVPLARMFADPMILAVKNSSPWNSFDDFVAAVRQNSGQPTVRRDIWVPSTWRWKCSFMPRS